MHNLLIGSWRPQEEEERTTKQEKGRGQGRVVPWIRSVRGLNGRIWLPSLGRPARSRAPAAAPARRPLRPPPTQLRRHQLLGEGAIFRGASRAAPIAAAAHGVLRTTAPAQEPRGTEEARRGEAAPAGAVREAAGSPMDVTRREEDPISATSAGARQPVWREEPRPPWASGSRSWVG
jgi:hypothetical protein